MYFQILRPVIENLITLHAGDTGQSVEDVLAQMDRHIINTSAQYWEDEPQINYHDPFCRLGYLYMHAAANATLFERVLSRSDEARSIIRQSEQNTLNVLSMGGGPGTELLGLVKYYRYHRNRTPPRRIDFTVVDNVFQWSETWGEIAAATESEFRSFLAEDSPEPTTISPMFLPFDVIDQSQYQSLSGRCNAANLVVFNYLFSENKTRLDHARRAVERLVALTSDDCLFLVIDRLEGSRQFNDEVVDIFESAFGLSIDYAPMGGRLDSNEQVSDMGPLLTQNLSRTPRITFYSGQSRSPSVFWFEAK